MNFLFYTWKATFTRSNGRLLFFCGEAMPGKREFTCGAWIVLIAIPGLVYLTSRMHARSLLLHNQTALLIKSILLFKKGVISTSVPFHLVK
jgi:hypothetical protein